MAAAVLAVLLLFAAEGSVAQCDLSGRWTGFMKNDPLYDNYLIEQSASNLAVIRCVFDF